MIIPEGIEEYRFNIAPNAGGSTTIKLGLVKHGVGFIEYEKGDTVVKKKRKYTDTFYYEIIKK